MDAPDDLNLFLSGFTDGWHGKKKVTKTGVYGRAYDNGKKARVENDSIINQEEAS